MKNQKKSRERSIEERYGQAKKNRRVLLICTILLLLLPLVGYASENLSKEGLRLLSGEELTYLPLNIGTYAILGVVVLFVIVLIISTIIVFIQMLAGAGLIWSVVGTVLFYGIIVSIFMAVVNWIYDAIGTDFNVEILGMQIDGSTPIPGPSETLGMALVNTLFYSVLLLISVIGMIVFWCRCKQLEAPALEEKAKREFREIQAEEERTLQKRLKKERKEQEEKERREYERFILEQARAAKANSAGLGEYRFFEGCATVEEAEIRFNKLIQIYEAKDGSGDPVLAKVIRKQYEVLSNQLKEHGDHTKKVSQGETEYDTRNATSFI